VGLRVVDGGVNDHIDGHASCLLLGVCDALDHDLHELGDLLGLRGFPSIAAKKSPLCSIFGEAGGYQLHFGQHFLPKIQPPARRFQPGVGQLHRELMSVTLPRLLQLQAKPFDDELLGWRQFSSHRFNFLVSRFG
jgi:hypothetical protein